MLRPLWGLAVLVYSFTRGGTLRRPRGALPRAELFWARWAGGYRHLLSNKNLRHRQNHPLLLQRIELTHDVPYGLYPPWVHAFKHRQRGVQERHRSGGGDFL